jgi:hypothetical protein
MHEVSLLVVTGCRQPPLDDLAAEPGQGELHVLAGGGLHDEPALLIQPLEANPVLWVVDGRAAGTALRRAKE